MPEAIEPDTLLVSATDPGVLLRFNDPLPDAKKAPLQKKLFGTPARVIMMIIFMLVWVPGIYHYTTVWTANGVPDVWSPIAALFHGTPPKEDTGTIAVSGDMETVFALADNENIVVWPTQPHIAWDKSVNGAFFHHYPATASTTERLTYYGNVQSVGCRLSPDQSVAVVPFAYYRYKNSDQPPLDWYQRAIRSHE